MGGSDEVGGRRCRYCRHDPHPSKASDPPPYPGRSSGPSLDCTDISSPYYPRTRNALTPTAKTRGSEACSWGVGKYESEDGCDGCREGLQWPSAAGVQGPPCLDVGDDSFDFMEDLVDSGVVGFVVGVKGKFHWFSFRGDHA